jgi:hypothetical protein
MRKPDLAVLAARKKSAAVVAVLMGVAWYWLQLPPAEQQSLMTSYPVLKHLAPLMGLIAYLGAKLWPAPVIEEPKE